MPKCLIWCYCAMVVGRWRFSFIQYKYDSKVINQQDNFLDIQKKQFGFKLKQFDIELLCMDKNFATRVWLCFIKIYLTYIQFYSHSQTCFFPCFYSVLKRFSNLFVPRCAIVFRGTIILNKFFQVTHRFGYVS